MIKAYKNKYPCIADDCFIAEQAAVIGDVTLKAGVSVWFGAVIRGDKDSIVIERGSNIQDNCTLHTDPDHCLSIGKEVTIGHNAIVHGATLEDQILVGMGAIILNGAHIEKHCIIGAGALVTENMHIPEGSIVVGCPAKVIKRIQPQQIEDIIANAQHYMELANTYIQEEQAWNK